MAEFEAELLGAIVAAKIFGWVVLPNHYHILVHPPDLHALLVNLGQLHGRTSHKWNGEEDCRRRKVWHRAAETVMKSERHFWATLNYVLHNPVRHGYVGQWQDWPFSSAAQYLADVPREEAERRWASIRSSILGQTGTRPSSDRGDRLRTGLQRDTG